MTNKTKALPHNSNNTSYVYPPIDLLRYMTQEQINFTNNPIL